MSDDPLHPDNVKTILGEHDRVRKDDYRALYAREQRVLAAARKRLEAEAVRLDAQVDRQSKMGRLEAPFRWESRAALLRRMAKEGG